MRRATWLIAALLASCAVGPDYDKPAAPEAASFKELAGWKPATPLDGIDRGAWWSVFRDPLLDRLEHALVVNNQTVRAQEAAYRQAQALVDEARANLFPTLDANVGVTRSSNGGGSGSRVSGTTTTTSGVNTGSLGTGGSGLNQSGTLAGGGTGGTTSTGASTGLTTGGFGSTRTTYTLEGSASWAPDVWGKVRRQIESQVAGAQVSAADLANALLSAQVSLATDYFELRTADATQALLDRTVADDRRAYEITQNQYAVGVAARSDVITAQTQLQGAVAQQINVGVARAQYEHAIAVLTGVPPADLTVAPGTLAADVPVAPPGLPSRLLERRPDIAAAERTMQEQNALIGVAIAAYYPDISLSALFGYAGNPLGSLISVSNRVWSIGAQATETLFDGGLRNAQVRAARAVYDESVANYRQTVLTAFQQVEDELSSLRILEREEAAEQEAVRLARRSVEIALNEYRAGTVAYTQVVTAQNTALSDEESLFSIQQSRLVASVSLIGALGGGWTAADLPDRDSLQERNPLNPENF